jgi:ribonucleotide monophosphatase NagD (HAD superfamily)
MGDFANFLEKSKKVVALDFDGVIHNDSKGFFNGTIYGEPMEGTETALKYLSENYKIVIFSCKSNPNRPLINDKTGTQLIWDWLESYNFKQYISDVVWGKPNALIYIDDKGFRFNDWQTTLEYLKET